MSRSTLPRSRGQIEVGPDLRAVGYHRGYTTWALLEAVRAHAHTGSVEAAGTIDPENVAELDQAADDDAMDAFVEACHPAEWPAWTDRDVWTVEEPTEADREWWAAETADVDVDTLACVTL